MIFKRVKRPSEQARIAAKMGFDKDTKFIRAWHDTRLPDDTYHHWSLTIRVIVHYLIDKVEHYTLPGYVMDQNDYEIHEFFQAIYGPKSTMYQAAFLRVESITFIQDCVTQETHPKGAKILVKCLPLQYNLDCPDVEFVLDVRNRPAMFKSICSLYKLAEHHDKVQDE